MLNGVNAKVLTATGPVNTAGSTLISAIKVVLAGGSAASTAAVYDGEAAVAADLRLQLAAGIGTTETGAGEWIAINSGNVHVVLAGTGAAATILWK